MYTQKGEQRNTGRTHFKKGFTPWNKGKVGVMPTPWNKEDGVKKECEVCFSRFVVPKCRKNTAKFCSTKCLGIANGKRATGKQYMLGTKQSPETISKRMLNMRGESNHKWKGDEVSYRSLHKWVERQLGKPTTCTDCGKVGYGRQIHWANVSQEYKRDVSDWMRLCAKCHKSHDLALKV